MTCWYCNDKDDSKVVAGKKACTMCYRDFNYDIDYEIDKEIERRKNNV